MTAISHQSAFVISEEDEMVVRLHVMGYGKGPNLGKSILDIVTGAGEVPEPVLLVL